MRRFIVVLMMVVGVATVGYSQTPTSPNTPHYSIGDLDDLGKLDLTRIYVSQVNKLNLLLPYVPFNQKGDAVSLSGMGIPNTKDNNGAIKNMDSSIGNYNGTTDETLNNLIPYADKADIIKSILFLQNVIEKIESGI